MSINLRGQKGPVRWGECHGVFSLFCIYLFYFTLIFGILVAREPLAATADGPDSCLICKIMKKNTKTNKKTV